MECDLVGATVLNCQNKTTAGVSSRHHFSMFTLIHCSLHYFLFRMLDLYFCTSHSAELHPVRIGGSVAGWESNVTYKRLTNYQLCHAEPNNCLRRIQCRALIVLDYYYYHGPRRENGTREERPENFKFPSRGVGSLIVTAAGEQERSDLKVFRVTDYDVRRRCNTGREHMKLLCLTVG